MTNIIPLYITNKSIYAPASNKDVPFMFMDLGEDPFGQSSMISSVKSLNNATPDNTKLFAVQRKNFLGPASPKNLKQG